MKCFVKFSRNIILRFQKLKFGIHAKSEFISKYSSKAIYSYGKSERKTFMILWMLATNAKNVINVTPIDGMNTEHEQ